MRIQKTMLVYENLDADIKNKVAQKYLKDPQNSVIRIPNADGTYLIDVIEVWHLGAYHLVLVKEEDLKRIHWEAYLQNTTDNMHLPFMDNENYYEFFEGEY